MEKRRKIKTGQTGSWDSHPYVRSERIVLRVSPEEFEQLEKNRLTHRYSNMSLYLRTQGLKPTPTANERKQFSALLAATFQLNKIGLNINQIARHLNLRNQVDSNVAHTLSKIQRDAHSILEIAKAGGQK